ncbi:MerR family transcriptional regulator [Streptomyces sp. A7024]|uniref:MerR family transcriptional regulator n=2 Tax=Streptomyces coryli TaxID=1128680 RepID=A0A6G4U5I6_9ACTN|nr:MerR family transcriptional regulator [Streptomyces coryli]
MWTLAELAERAADALRSDGRGAGVGSGRVREVPGERVIRWYTTIGLVDPPAARRGRVALYGERHLRQLVAIKRLQAQGRSIAEIQALLAGATDDRLAAVAGGQGRDRFWSAAPVADAGDASDGADASGGAGAADTSAATAATDATAEPPTDPPRAEPPTVTPAVRLAPGVTLVLDDAGRPPAPDDLAALADAAAPLLAALRARGLTTAPAGRAADSQGGAP